MLCTAVLLWAQITSPDGHLEDGLPGEKCGAQAAPEREKEEDAE